MEGQEDAFTRTSERLGHVLAELNWFNSAAPECVPRWL
jgi:hypothetical protein